MDSVTDTYKYEYLCFDQGHLRSSGKRGQTKIGIWHCNTCFLVTFSQRTRKMALKHFMKIKIGKKKSENQGTMAKSGYFQQIAFHNSVNLKYIDLKFCTHIYQPLPINVYSSLSKNLVLREKSKRKKLETILEIFRIFKIGQFWKRSEPSFSLPDGSAVQCSPRLLNCRES